MFHKRRYTPFIKPKERHYKIQICPLVRLTKNLRIIVYKSIKKRKKNDRTSWARLTIFPLIHMFCVRMNERKFSECTRSVFQLWPLENHPTNHRMIFKQTCNGPQEISLLSRSGIHLCPLSIKSCLKDHNNHGLDKVHRRAVFERH